MLVQKTGNYSNQTKNVKQTGLKMNKRAKPLIPSTSVNMFLRVNVLLKRLVLHYRIKQETFVALCFVVNYWEMHQQGISCHCLNDQMGSRDDSHRDLQYRLTNLVSKGFLEVVGYGKWKCHLYGPTLDCLAMMKSLDAMLVK